MDDYLPKPIRADALAAILARWTGHGSSEVPDRLPRALTSSTRDSIRDRLRELEEVTTAGMVAKFVASFLNRAPEYLLELTETLNRKDFDAFAPAAHSLQGAAGNLGANAMASLCEQLERHASNGPPRSQANLLDRLHLEYDAARHVLETPKLLPGQGATTCFGAEQKLIPPARFARAAEYGSGPLSPSRPHGCATTAPLPAEFRSVCRYSWAVLWASGLA